MSTGSVGFYITSKFRFAKRMIRHRLEKQPRSCPYCGPSSPVHLLRRKKFIMDILKCGTCQLVFRWPMDTPQEHDAHYHDEFAVDAPQIALPSPQEARSLMESNFVGSPLDLNAKIRVLKALHATGKVLDFGCSWGYGTFQLQQHGYEAVGFEISKPRADYARRELGLTVIDSLSELYSLRANTFDIIFSNHVLEHILPIRDTLVSLSRLLTRDGIVFHVLPNFTGRTARAGKWVKWIGEDHPIAPTIEFFKGAIPGAGLEPPQFGSSPFDENSIKLLARQCEAKLPVDGDELLVVSRKAVV
jgi:2-polyprenyl-3-methyl-5-hydroxy-6-metoxy-1,4-benzoquinol methylase